MPPRKESPFVFWPTSVLAGCGVIMIVFLRELALFTAPFVIGVTAACAVAGVLKHIVRRWKAPPADYETAVAEQSGFSAPALRYLRYFLAFWAVLILAVLTVILIAERNRAIRSRELVAQICLRKYATAQLTFALGKQATIPGNTSPGLGENAYADNFRNLFYGADDDGQWLHLVPESMADAYLVDNALSGAPTLNEGADRKAAPHHGYLFVEDLTGDVPAAKYDSWCTLMAIPVELGATGRYVYWINQEGVVYSQEPRAPKGTTAEELLKLYRGVPGSTPAMQPAADWQALHGW